MEINEKLNIMLLGDGEVGKTTILERYFNRLFYPETKITIGIEYYVMQYKDKEYNKTYNIKFWDTAGQERFQSLTKNYYQKANGIMITLAINRRKSFYNLKKWISSISECGGEVDIVILCNKFDLESEREVSDEELTLFCQEEKVQFFYTSAKSGLNIDEAFEYIVKKVIKRKSIKEKIQIQINNPNKDTSNCIC